MSNFYCPLCASQLSKVEKEIDAENNSLLENLFAIKKALVKKLKDKIMDDYSEKYSCDKCKVELVLFDPLLSYKSAAGKSWAIGFINKEKEKTNESV